MHGGDDLSSPALAHHLYTHPYTMPFTEAVTISSMIGGRQHGTDIWRTVWQFLPKLDTLVPHDPAVVLLGISPKD